MHYRYSMLWLVIIFILPSCGLRYIRKSITPLTNKNAIYVSTKQGVTVRGQKLSPGQLKKLFDGRGNRINRHRITAIHLAITNGCSIPLFLSLDNIGLTLISDATLKTICFESTSSIVIKNIGKGLGIATIIVALSCGPLTFGLVPLGYYYALAGGSIAATTALLTPLVAIPSAIHNIQQCNQEINQDINEQMVIGSLVIPSCQTRDCLLFVAQKHYHTKFAITLADQHNKEIQTFNVKLT